MPLDAESAVVSKRIAGDALVLALDQGGHASRAVLFDASGETCRHAFAQKRANLSDDVFVTR